MVNSLVPTPLMGKRIVARGVDAFDVAMWKDALTNDRRRLDWVRIRNVRQRAGDACDVTLEVAHRRYTAFASSGRRAAEIVDAIVDHLTDEAMQISREAAERAEVEAIPEFLLVSTDDPIIGDGHWHCVAWSVADACLIKELIQGRVGVILRRLSPVDRMVSLDVGVPEDLHDTVQAGDKSVPKSDRVFEAVVAACRAASDAQRTAACEDAIPF